jgi:hypothetical protein
MKEEEVSKELLLTDNPEREKNVGIPGAASGFPGLY